MAAIEADRLRKEKKRQARARKAKKKLTRCVVRVLCAVCVGMCVVSG